MVTPGRRIASPSFAGVVADPPPAANRARPCPRVASRRRTRAWSGHRTALGRCGGLCGHTSACEPEGPAAGGAASGLSCLPEAIHRALGKEAGGGQL
jgi:hypothetical protein